MMQDQLAMKQVEVLLELHSKKLLDQIRQLREELSRVKQDLSKEIKEVSKQGSPVSYPQQQFQQQFHPQPVQQPAQHAPSTQPIDRNGVAPADVSIEKFFYVGGK